ncbi:MAG: hypothetical protein IPN94_18075 [Sphingobacteriales bacterium]|nr:hypothetical protein [Sphingobacteriales bacterium]
MYGDVGGCCKAALLVGDVTIIVGLLITVIFIAAGVLIIPLLSVAFKAHFAYAVWWAIPKVGIGRVVSSPN